MEINKITHEIIGAAIQGHAAFGPGMLESAYHKSFVYEISQRGLHVESQVTLPLKYRGITIDAGYRIDILVERCVVVEVKAVEEGHRVHRAQLLCYLRLSGCRVGLIFNFNETRLVDGITRMIL